MAPTISPGDNVVVDTWSFRSRKPRAGEIVVFHHHGYDIMKRVVAEDASTIEGIDGSVEVNGRAITEPYAVHSSITPPMELYNFGPYRIADGEIFVMGDNRDYSLDSRIRSGADDYGPVFFTDVFGKPLYRFRGSMKRATYDGQAIK
jgi:signal peptidase I